MPAAEPEVRITLGPGGPVVPVVQQYRYLGRVFDHKLGINDTVIALRISGAFCAINKLRPVWDSPLTADCKEALFECFVRPALTFSCASWLLTQAQLQRIDRAFTLCPVFGGTRERIPTPLPLGPVQIAVKRHADGIHRFLRAKPAARPSGLTSRP